MRSKKVSAFTSFHVVHKVLADSTTPGILEQLFLGKLIKTAAIASVGSLVVRCIVEQHPGIWPGQI